jgi:hypothetical protein
MELLEGLNIPDGPADAAPEPDEMTCQADGCREPLKYGGRGRKPRFCPEHKTGKKTVSRSGSGQNRLAGQAADALVQLNCLIGTGLMVIPPVLGRESMMETGAAIAAAQDGFRESAFEALKTDPALCRMIVRAGVTSGKLALMIAYGTMAISVAPTAYLELRKERS